MRSSAGRLACGQFAAHVRGRSLSSVGGVSTVGVIGLGLMGHGIAQTAAEKGFNVVAIELEDRFLEGGMKRIVGSVKKLTTKAVEKGKMDATAGEAHVAGVLGRITPTTDRAALAGCDCIIEAVIEDIKLKEVLYQDIGATVSDSCIIASNTSSLSIGKMAGHCGRPSQMIGMHFFNPVQMMKLVEVIKTDQTDPALFSRAMEFTRALGKTPVECIDTPGFVVNRLLVPYLCSALTLVERGVASATDVDVAMKLGAGHPMGPIALADYVGLDTCLAIISGWKQEFPNVRNRHQACSHKLTRAVLCDASVRAPSRTSSHTPSDRLDVARQDPAFFVPDSLKAKVAEGKLGRKSGEGFFVWDGDKLAA